MAQVTKKQFINGSIWKIVEQFSTKGVSLLFSIILARLLDPEVYGVLALTVVFTNLSDILIEGGFGTALIRKKEVDDYDFSCVLIVSFSIAIVLYVALFIGAPSIAKYYETPQLTAVLRVIGLVLFIQAFSSVRTALVSRNLQFKLLFRCNFIAALLSGIIGIICAVLKMGIWALVAQRLSQLTISTILIMLRITWKFQFRFNFSRFKEIFRFSIGVVSASLINYVTSSIYSLVVGKQYSLTDLGYSDKGAQLPTQVSLYTFGAMSSVLLPTLSSCQSDLERVKQIVRKVVRMTSYLITPMMVGLALVSKELIELLFTSVWLPAVPIMRANCIYYFATPFMLIFVQVYLALGYSTIRIKTEILRMIMQIVGVLLFGVVFKCSIYQLSYVISIVALLSAIIAYLFAKPLIDYKIREVLKDIFKPIIAAIVMGVVGWGSSTLLMNNLTSSNIVMIVFKVIVSAAVYVVLSIVLNIHEFHEIKSVLLSVGKKK